MKKQLLIMIIIAILITVVFSGCSTQNNNENQFDNTLDPERNRFIGTWQTNPVDIYWTFDFFSNGTFQRMEGIVDGPYKIKDGKLFLNYTDEIWLGETFNYSFSNNNTTVTLVQTSSDESVILYKQ